MSPIYESMKDWTVDRMKAKLSHEQASTPEQEMQRRAYCEWLDGEKPEWLEEIKES